MSADNFDEEILTIVPMLISSTRISSAMTFGRGPRLRAEDNKEPASCSNAGVNLGHSNLKDMIEDLYIS